MGKGGREAPVSGAADVSPICNLGYHSLLFSLLPPSLCKWPLISGLRFPIMLHHEGGRGRY